MKLRSLILAFWLALVPAAFAAPITDLAGNALTGGTSTDRFTFTANSAGVYETYILAPADSTPPTVSSINRADANNTNAASVNFTVTFSESVTGVDTSDFTLTPTGTASGTISGISGSGTTYTVTVNTITGAGTLRLDLNSSGTGITDAAANPIATGFTSGQTYTVDRVAPTVSSINRADANNTNTASVNFTVTFSETVTGVDTPDFTLTPTGTASGTISGISGSGTTYTVTVNTITGAGTLRLDLKSSGTGITDATANAIAAGFTSGQTYNVDRVAPTVSSINRADANNTNAASVNFTVTFSESVTGVDTSDFTLTASGTATGTISGISGSGNTYTVTVNTITGAGTLRLDLKSSGTGITDATANAIAAGFTSGQTYNVDRVAPTVSSINRADANNTNAASVNFTVTFSESVTGVDTSDFTLTPTGTASGSISGISGSGNTYTVTVNTIAGEGTLHVDLNSSGTGITDAASNAIAAGFTSGQTYTVDRVAPVITSSTTASGSQNVLFSYSITASGSAVSYGASGMPAGLSVNPTSGEISGTPTQSGSFNISLTATDAAGNIGTGSVALTLAPTLSYNDWKALHFSSGQQADSAVSGPDADPDGDGLSNLMEYALDSDPLVSSVEALPVLDTVKISSSTYLRLTIPRPNDRPDVSPVVEVSGDLSTAWSSSGLVTITNTSSLLVVRDSTPINSTARFIRWNIGSGWATPAMGGRLTNINPGTTAAPVSNPSGQPFARAAVWRGFADSVSGTSLTVAGTPWTAGQFTSTPHYLTVLEGSMAGLNLEVTANTGSSLTLGSSLASILVSGQRFELRPHHTIASLFGASNPTSFAGGSTASNADELQVFDNSTQINTRYFYQNSGFGGTGWHSATGTISDRSGSIIDPEQGFDIVNKKGGSRTFLAIGEARTQPQAMLVAVGKNWFVVSQPVTVSLQDFGIYTGSSSDGLVGSTTLKSADEFQHWNGSTWDRFYYKTGGTGGSGWRSTTDTSVDRGSESLRTGDVIIIQRKASPDFLFFRPAAP